MISGYMIDCDKIQDSRRLGAIATIVDASAEPSFAY